MKNYKFPLMGFALVLLITSCKKEDVRQLNPSSASPASTATGSWNSLTNWSVIKENDTITTHFSQIADTNINANVLKSGLVLVFKKDGSTIQALPFQDKLTGTYWYYQISKGSLRIDGNSTDSRTDLNGQSFSYFILNPEQISRLEAKGKTKFDLMQSSYEQAQAFSK